MNRWLRQHGSGEKSFARGLDRFFSEQARRIARATESFPGIGVDSIAQVFSVDDENEALQPVLQRNVSRLSLIGALDELNAVEDATEGVKGLDDQYWQDEAREFIDTIPANVIDRIRASVDQAFDQPFWKAITEQVGADLRGVIQQAIDDGASGSTMAKRIREELGGSMARKRALRIARTETTGALNSGHLEAMVELEAGGLLRGKQWLAIADNDVRRAHIDLDGSIVRTKEAFSVGGYDAPYPGWWGLPASQRIHCRCTTIGVLA